MLTRVLRLFYTLQEWVEGKNKKLFWIILKDNKIKSLVLCTGKKILKNISSFSTPQEKPKIQWLIIIRQLYGRRAIEKKNQCREIRRELFLFSRTYRKKCCMCFLITISCLLVLNDAGVWLRWCKNKMWQHFSGKSLSKATKIYKKNFFMLISFFIQHLKESKKKHHDNRDLPPKR